MAGLTAAQLLLGRGDFGRRPVVLDLRPVCADGGHPGFYIAFALMPDWWTPALDGSRGVRESYRAASILRWLGTDCAPTPGGRCEWIRWTAFLATFLRRTTVLAIARPDRLGPERRYAFCTITFFDSTVTSPSPNMPTRRQ